MSDARSNSFPVTLVLAQKPEKKKHRGLFRRLAKAIPGRKKKSPGPSAADGYGSGSESIDHSDSPQPLTPSLSMDSLDVDNVAVIPANYLVHVQDETDSASPVRTALEAAKLSFIRIPPVEVLKEVRSLLQCLQSDNQNSQERVGTRQQFWSKKEYDSTLWGLMIQEWQLLHDYHINQGKEIDNILTSLEWLPT